MSPRPAPLSLSLLPLEPFLQSLALLSDLSLMSVIVPIYSKLIYYCHAKLFLPVHFWN